MKTKSKFKPLNEVIQVCHVCGKVDVYEGHEDECAGYADFDEHDDWGNRD